MKLHEFKILKGSNKDRKRVGRGTGSGHGKTSCRGGKGLTARSGAHNRWGYEGGQMPLMRRIPKRGFHNSPFQYKLYQVVNLSDLNNVNVDLINPDVLEEKGFIKHSEQFVKILAKGDFTKKINIIADAFSETAKEKIIALGGTAEIRAKKAEQ